MPHSTKGPEPQLVARTPVVVGVGRDHYLMTADLITADRLGGFGGFVSGHTRHYFS